MNWTCQKLIFFTILIIVSASNDDGYLRSQKLEQKEEVNVLKNQNTISDTLDLQPIRITYNLTNFNSSDISDEDRADFTSIIDGLINFMNKFIKVVPSPGPNKLNRRSCVENEVPITHQNNGVLNSDLQIYIKHQKVITYQNNIYPDVAAYASSCDSPEAVLPTFGGISILTKLVTNLKGDNKFQKTARILFHEILHIIGFDSNSKNDSKKKMKSTFMEAESGTQYRLLQSPKVLGTARKFFECESLSGIPISKDFTHWLFPFLLDDIMFAEIQDQQTLSIFTVMYFKDFHPKIDFNENLVEPYTLGMNKGCYSKRNKGRGEIQYICSNNCSYHGICINNQCMFNPGYSGEDCFLKCEYSFEGECLSQCPEGKFANPDNTCKPGCPRGYYIKDNHTCSLCDFSCSVCDGPLKNNCKACQYLSHLNEKYNTCVSCNYDQYFNSKEQKCKNCPMNCLSCESAIKCTLCNEGFETPENNCIKKIILGCLEYNPLNHNECLNCGTGYFINNNDCTPCSEGCLSCTNKACTKCDSSIGFALVNEYNQLICENNIPYCLPPCTSCRLYHTLGYYCEACDTGFVLQGFMCKQSCDIGFYEDQKVCKKCDPSCLECSRSATACSKFNLDNQDEELPDCYPEK